MVTMTASGRAAIGYIIATACALCAVAQETRPVDSATESDEKWPQELAGRTRRIITAKYVLYARASRDAADKGTQAVHHEGVGVLRQWLDAELAAISSRYCEPDGRGLILAIEPGPEPDPALDDWRKRSINRSRKISWTSARHLRGIHTTAGRPYSFFKKCYFTESYLLPYEDALRIGILKTSYPKAAWVCVLTTDSHLVRAFDQKYAQHKRDYIRVLRKAKPAGLGECIMGGGSLVMLYACQSRYRSIDLQLMRLQRGEILTQAIINACLRDEKDKKVRAEALANLERDTDEAWKALYFTRPIE